MPEQRIPDDSTDAERESSHTTGGGLQAQVGSGILAHTTEQGVDLVKSTTRRTVHFLLPDSQTPISTRSDTEDEDTAVAESVGQGRDACSEKGQLSTGPPDDGVKPVHQTVRSLLEVAIMDGASDQESIVTLPASPGPDMEVNVLIDNFEDDTVRAREGDSDISQLMDGTNGEGTHLPSSFDDQGPINETLESVKERCEDSSLIEAPTENVSQSYDAVNVPERLANESAEDIAMEVDFTDTVVPPISVGMDKAEPAVVSPTKNCDLNEEVTASDDTAEMAGFHNTPVDDPHAQSQPEQHNTDTLLAGKSHEQSIRQESLLQPTYADDAPWIKSSKRPLEINNETSPAKRQRMDVALETIYEESLLQTTHVDDAQWTKPSKRPLEATDEAPPAKRQRIEHAFEPKKEQTARNGESSSTAVSQQDGHPKNDGEGSKIEPEHTPIAGAAPNIPTLTDWSSFTVVNLRKELATRGLRRGGVKAILVQRLTEYERTQALQASLEAQSDQLILVESESNFAAEDKGKGPEKTSEAIADVVNSLDNDTVAADGRDDNGNEVVEDIVKNLVDEVIAQDGIESAKLSTVEMAGGGYPAPPLGFNDTAAPDLSANVEMQDERDWQDDSYEQVVLLTQSPLGGPVQNEPVQPEMDADISLESIEAPVVEQGIRDGTPPRCTGSGTMWIAKEA